MSKEFDLVIEEVAEHSKTAAKYLEKHGNRTSTNLSGMFTWGDTPAGHEFWSVIGSKISHAWPEYVE